jgi:predicted nucleotidyltransferase
MAAERPEVLRVVLFGSFAREDYGARSDIDLLVVLKSSDRPFAERVADFLRFIPPYPTDVFPFTLAEIEQRTASGDPFLTRALAEGILLHPA